MFATKDEPVKRIPRSPAASLCRFALLQRTPAPREERIARALFTHYRSQKQSKSKSSSSSPLDEPKSIYLGFIHQKLSTITK
ncbi:hypothetical protein EYF80_018377 [Liparis tanakae]|uniref:Uncharacterized protein n=1 Tax=Liparis tanakae TaxID=230148 RepID=A0A4Z2I0L4_9TELE|nr:hypothetical protein EYF80_018377 [Liparis tanakae]